MKYQLGLLITLPLFFAACASTHPGKMGKIVGGRIDTAMKVSAERQSYYSDDHYTFVVFTVENNSEDMLRIKAADIIFNPRDKTANVLIGNDLVSWATAEEEELKKTERNRKLAQGALMVAGLITGSVGSATNNTAVTVIGGSAALAGGAWSLTDAINRGVRNAKNPSRVPDQHIYAPFSVPIEKFVRKWAVIQHSKNAGPETIRLRLTLANGSEGIYAIEIQ